MYELRTQYYPEGNWYYTKFYSYESANGCRQFQSMLGFDRYKSIIVYVD